jgi:hypothetical protein
LIVIEAVSVPLVDGVNAIEIVQLPPAGTGVEHVLVCLKSLALTPVRWTDAIGFGAVPGFEKMTVWLADVHWG